VEEVVSVQTVLGWQQTILSPRVFVILKAAGADEGFVTVKGMRTGTCDVVKQVGGVTVIPAGLVITTFETVTLAHEHLEPVPGTNVAALVQPGSFDWLQLEQ
jgi:hypothetical protein